MLNTDLLSSLKAHFGFSNFRPGQQKAIENLLDNQHTLVVMPTGSGKSLIFQLAAMHLPGITLVISPLIALMKDQVDSLSRRGIPATYINSSMPVGEQKSRLKAMAAGDYRMIYIAPERLRNVTFLEALKHQKIALLAVDEVHCISEWGHDFRPDYLHIAQFRSILGSPLTVALTATATPQVQNEIERLLGISDIRHVVTGFNRPNLAFEVRYTANPPARFKALQDLLTGQPVGGMIIYTGTRRDAEEVAEFVRTVLGINARHYHAGLLSEERTAIQDAFMYGSLSIVTATNAFGMGIDRPDVRQVIHFSIPGSLEAYYQEAGRAGRDEKPAKAVLLYSPADRSLQEWLISQSALTPGDIRGLFAALQPFSQSQRATTLERLSLLTRQSEIKVRVGRAELERTGMVENLGEEGLSFRVKLRDWNETKLDEIFRNNEQRLEHRRKQLDAILAYAESNACRRKIILEHFGDLGPANAEVCCDNCQLQSTVSATPLNRIDQLTQLERAALIILDAVHRLSRGVGRLKLEQILKGSKAVDILRYGYTRNTYYGRLAVFSKADILEMIDDLVEQGYMKVVGGRYPVIKLTPKGEGALQTKAVIAIKRVLRLSKNEIERKKAEKLAGGTIEYTAQLIDQGLDVAQIASERGLKTSTIYDHAAQLIAVGRIPIKKIVPEEVRLNVETAICQVGALDQLYPIKLLLPERIDYNIIRCVVENWKCNHSASTSSVLKKNETLPAPSPEDLITTYLARPHPRKLSGPWKTGWALDFHSQFSGGDWKRSSTGDLAYRLKYLGDLTVLPALVNQATGLGVEHPELFQVDAIVPVPPSIQRLNDPVSNFASLLANHLQLAYLPVLKKVKQTAQQKELHTLAQKRANVTGAFALSTGIAGKRVLVTDDLYDSGATLEEIYHLLCRAGAVQIAVLTLTRSIHSDS